MKGLSEYKQILFGKKKLVENFIYWHVLLLFFLFFLFLMQLSQRFQGCLESDL